MNIQTKIDIESGFWFLIPAIIAFYFDIYAQGIILLFVIFFSITHIIYKTKVLILLDVSFAWLLMATNILLITFGNITSIFCYIAIVCSIIAIFFFKNRKHKKYHYNLWHLFSSLTSLFSLLTFNLYMK